MRESVVVDYTSVFSGTNEEVERQTILYPWTIATEGVRRSFRKTVTVGTVVREDTEDLETG